MCGHTVSIFEVAARIAFIVDEVVRHIGSSSQVEARIVRDHWRNVRSHTGLRSTGKSANFRPSKKRTRWRST